MLVKCFLTAIICVNIFQLCSGSFGTEFFRRKKLVKQNKQQQAAAAGYLQGGSQTLTASYIVQKLDHDNATSNVTFKQRYWVNNKYWKKSSGPVFLYIGGEDTFDPIELQSGSLITYAQTYGALIFGLEHRFYGQSLNNNGLNLDQIKFLTIQQALADLVYFRNAMTTSYNLAGNKWISFGGSYPGVLSAALRMKYPNVVNGAVASSAPMLFQVNFEGYNNVVAASLSNPVVGGSTQCLAAVQSAFATIDAMLAAGQASQLASDFYSCETLQSDQDKFEFVSNIASLFDYIVQYNNQLLAGQNIQALCAAMTSVTRRSRTPYQNLVNILSSDWCTDNSWSGFISQLKQTSFSLYNPQANRQWFYQTCTQFGYCMTCDIGTQCPFSQRMTLNFDLEVCQEVFGLSAQQVNASVSAARDFFNPYTHNATNILFVNGGIDPWHSLGVLSAITSVEPAIYVASTAHCDDMQPNLSSDPAAIRTARQNIQTQIGVWLAQSK